MNTLQNSPLRILLAEDLLDIAESTAFLLRSEGYEVELAFDGPAAVRLAREVQPDFVLLDIGLPELDGFTVAWQIRQQLGFEVPLIALTGWDRPEDQDRAQMAGFDAYLIKPVECDLLLQKLEQLGARKPSERRAS